MEYRRDPFSDRWTIVAPNRVDRPNDFDQNSHVGDQSKCPFCPGREFETPNPVDVIPSGTRSDEWQVRVVPNRYPAVSKSVDLDDVSPFASYLKPVSGYGIHEVIIETPRHTPDLLDLSVDELLNVLQAYQGCHLRAASDPHIAHGMLFKNQGSTAGASLVHAHSQFLASTMILPTVQRELEVAREFLQRSGECLYCRVSQAEASRGERLIFQTDHFRCFVPFASRVSYEVCLLPVIHSPRFETVPTGELRELAQCLRILLRKMQAHLPGVPFNYLVHTAPFDSSAYDHYHWHIELIPRILPMAGFEWGADAFVNVITPEDAASRLRAAS